MKLSDTEIEAAVAAVRTTMARTKLEHWPDGLLLQLLQLDQLTKINEHMVALRKFHVSAIGKVADLLELIEQQLPTAPHVPEEEAAEVGWRALMNRELDGAYAAGVEAGPVTTSREPTKDVGNVTVVDPDHYA